MKTATVLSALLAVALGAPSVNDALYRRQGQNFQTFTGALGGIAATPVTDSGDAKRKFQVKGDTFVNVAAALQRSCDQQFNACANKANGGDKTLSVSACSDQKTQCDAAGKGAASGNQSAANVTAPATGISGNATAPAIGISGNATAAAVGSSTNGTASNNPCDTAGGKVNGKGKKGKKGKGKKSKANAGKAKQNAGQANNAGKANQNKGAADKNNNKSNNEANKGAAATADPCNQKVGAANRRSIVERRITRRFKVA